MKGQKEGRNKDNSEKLPLLITVYLKSHYLFLFIDLSSVSLSKIQMKFV